MEASAELGDLDGELLTPESAGELLFELLVDLKVRNRLSAKEACLVACWAANAGATGDVNKLGKLSWFSFQWPLLAPL